MKLSELASRLSLQMVGQDVEIEDVCSVEKPKAGFIGYAEDLRVAKLLQNTDVSAILGPPGSETLGTKPVLLAVSPKNALIGLLGIFRPFSHPPPGIHPFAVIGKTTQIPPSVSVGAFTVVEDGTVIGEHSILYPLVYIGRNVKIGNRCILYPGCVLLDGTEIMNGVIVQSGAVIGAEGFGFFRDKTGQMRKIPQTGIVRLGDQVEIGANTTVDRATIDATEMGAHSKLDNLIQVGHNVRIGESALIAAQVGISGSVKIGDRVTMGGQAGLKDHIQVGNDVTIAGQAGVFGDLPDKATVSGYPAISHATALRLLVLFQRLPELFDRVKKLEEAQKKDG